MLSRGWLNDVNLRSRPTKLNRSAQEASHHGELIAVVYQEAIGAASPLIGLNYRYTREVTGYLARIPDIVRILFIRK